MIDITEKEFKQLAEFIKKNCGVNLSKKKTLILGRLQSTLIEGGFRDFSDYYNYIIKDTTGEAIVALIDKVTTNYTFFMREREHFIYLKNTLLPYLSQAERKNRDLRIWSAGCSSGEEPYTIALILHEYFGEEKKLWDTKILATDISTKALSNAIKGIYSNEQLAEIPAVWKTNYFKAIDTEHSMINENIKNEVLFRRLNLMDETFPFKKKFHIIFCRNVMIYFDTATKEKLIKKLYEYTEYGGYLFIGHSESLTSENRYKYIMPSVYRKE